jgi:hypothetical protein
MSLRRWLLPRLNLAECKFDKMPTDWTFDEIPREDERLKACKSRIDKPYKENPRKWEELTILLEPSRMIRDTMCARYDPQYVTNAWLKLIEIFAVFGIAQGPEPIKMFDNASAPGAFIMAAHYWKTCVYPGQFTWMASTWLADSYVALDDRYGLARAFPERFTTFKTEFNGDTMDVKYLRYMEATYGGHFNLYTSDLGMRIPDGKYNCQEAVNARGNLGQILMGLVTLTRGGVMITKQFSHMSSFTISIMAIMSSVFEKLWVTKPLTSKPDNSEEYLVGIGYLGIPSHLKDIMYDMLEGTVGEYNIEARNFLPPLLAKGCISQEFERTIVAITRSLVDSQCSKIDANLREYASMLAEHRCVPSAEFTAANMSEDIIEGWIALAPFKRMSKKYDYLRLYVNRAKNYMPRGSKFVKK